VKNHLIHDRQVMQGRSRRWSPSLGQRPWRILALPAMLLLALATSAVGAAQSAEVPANFDDQVVADVDLPTALAFTPDDRILVTEKTGRLWVVKDDARVEPAALDISQDVCSNGERGLLGVAIDPDFETNGYIYLYYTFNKSDGCPTRPPGTPVNRVSRFTMDGDSVLTGSELKLLDNIPSPGGNHNGGDVQIGNDGLLYVSVGDGGCDVRVRRRCQGENQNSRQPHLLLAKILRINTDGTIPAGNPYATRGKRCAMSGRTKRGNQCQETFASGLRNPFRIAFNPNVDQAVFRINDVGGQAWEEINSGKRGADYGWNLREGRCKIGSFRECGKPPRGLTNPAFVYSHRNGLGCASITGGAFVPDGVWPEPYQGTYLFADFVCDRIFYLEPGAADGLQDKEFASNLGGPTAMAFGPSPSGQSLYYTSFTTGGELHRISAT